MSPGPVFLPLTTRGRHLPSSWSHFPKLFRPVTHHTLTCSPLSRSLYSLLTHHSAWQNCMCYCVMYCCTLWSMLSRTPALRCILWCPVLFSVFVGLFLWLNCAFLHLDPDFCFSSVLLARTVTEFSQQTWVQRGSSLISVREMGALRSMPGTSGKSLVSRRQRRPASLSSSGEAWPSPSNPGCQTGIPRSRWRTISNWLCIWAALPSGWS